MNPLNNKQSLAFILSAIFAATILAGSSSLQPISAVDSSGSVTSPQTTVGSVTCILSNMQPSIPVAMNTAYLPQASGPNLMKSIYAEKEIYNCNVVISVDKTVTTLPFQKLVSIYTKVLDATNDNRVQEVVHFKTVECTKDLKGNFITIPFQPIQAACTTSEPDTLATAPALRACTITTEMPIQMNTISPEPTKVREIEAEKQVYLCLSGGGLHQGLPIQIIKEVILFTKISESVSADLSNTDQPVIVEGSQETFVVATCEKDVSSGHVIGCESSIPPNLT